MMLKMHRSDTGDTPESHQTCITAKRMLSGIRQTFGKSRKNKDKKNKGSEQ